MFSSAEDMFLGQITQKVMHTTDKSFKMTFPNKHCQKLMEKYVNRLPTSVSIVGNNAVLYKKWLLKYCRPYNIARENI